MEVVNWKNMKKDDIYCCFSFPLYKFIVAHGLEAIAKETHKKTGRTFSVFMKGEKLQALLTEWTANRPVKSENTTVEKYSDWKLKGSGDESSERKD